MWRGAAVLVCLGLAAMAAVAPAQVGKTPRARAAPIATSGSFEISDSGEGQPIFAATGISPGGSARGTVTIEDAGSEPVALHLRRGELVDASGLGGGALSGRLQLSVVDVTEPTAPRTVYAGPLASMPDQAAGELEAGEARTFEFTATLPEGGAPSIQNAVQGAATTVAYSWVATELDKGGEGAPGGEKPGPPPGGGGGDGGVGVEAAPGDRPLDLSVPKIRRALRGDALVAWVSCDRACRLYVRGRVRATGMRTHRTARIRFARKGLREPGAQRLRIPVPPGLRRWLQENPGRRQLQVKLHFVAVAADGRRDTVRKSMKLRARGHEARRANPPPTGEGAL